MSATTIIPSRIPYRALSVLLTLLLAGTLAHAQQFQPGQPRYQVQGMGASGYRADAVGRSREEALEAAQRDAVEKVSGVMIESVSKLKNFALVKDEVLSRSKGFIETYKIIKEGRDRELYNVVIDAVVVKADFIKQLDQSLENLYRRVGKPRIMIVVKESFLDRSGNPKDANSPSAQGVFEKEIRKILIKQGFTFIDARAAAGMSLLQVALRGEDIAREKVVEAARTTEAEIIMLGNATTQEKGTYGSFFIAQADLAMDVVRVDSGQIMASEVISARGLSINQNSANVKSAQQAAIDMTPKLMEQVSFLWIKDKNEGGRIELVVKNASFGDLLALKRALSVGVGGVSSLRQRSYKNKVALFELQTRKTAGEIAEGLYEQQFKKFELEIEDVSAKTLTVSLTKR
ncbi:MAG: hypothetical protein O7A69_09060 [SAR324 cluster bacterium]|nr:hypothetical protein [SAR324 cluster bacterium]